MSMYYKLSGANPSEPVSGRENPAVKAGLFACTGAGKEAATTVMPLLSAALYLGQFLSPLIVSPIASATGMSPYSVGLGIAVLYLL